jgi:hypothetical protein
VKLPDPTPLAPATHAGQRRPPRRAASPFGAGWSLDVVLLSFVAAAPASDRPRRARRSQKPKPRRRETGRDVR